jgi:hypothetical protein
MKITNQTEYQTRQLAAFIRAAGEGELNRTLKWKDYRITVKYGRRDGVHCRAYKHRANFTLILPKPPKPLRFGDLLTAIRQAISYNRSGYWNYTVGPMPPGPDNLPLVVELNPPKPEPSPKPILPLVAKLERELAVADSKVHLWTRKAGTAMVNVKKWQRTVKRIEKRIVEARSSPRSSTRPRRAVDSLEVNL